ncbi:hypothetical protein SMGD1_2146 [Sulfurimonas gotlandica GD1]|uniref:Uncharacterized protein n=1 Tax=Sulfurimonas gotlandica (strain DSM 19862 / JCM 16533 / GD1) TaxID=929558 RepID=B6BN54_SULGG|nr:BatD family protein [Sulfurimonas gotlandica]EDZ61601.1 conserved hypothetical protein [Sulfurimonas gotlandica GD1]EHP30669.1 hypothetical protein SMGD1_2146 [Sulfurimonas gotlandica GD1]
MRSNLGRIFLIILIFLSLNAFASTYKWSVKSDKAEAMTNEAIYLKYVCEYSDAAGLYVIEFNPVVDNEKYSIELLSESENITDGKKINVFEFIAFVKVPGEMSFIFDTRMKKTNKDSIQNTVLGRDNADYEEFSTRFIRQEAIVVNVKQSSSDLVGEFVLNAKKDKEQLKAFEPYHLEISIAGSGDFKLIKPILFEIDGVKIFSQKVIQDVKLTKNGYQGSWSQKFAFVGEKDFTIPKLSIEYFDIKEKKAKELIVEETQIKITKAYKKEELLDVEQKSFEFSYNFIYYILTFIAGFLFAKINFKRVKKLNFADSSFLAKVDNAKSFDELMIILALKDARKYESFIRKVETKEIKSLKEAKKALINE